MCEPVSEIVDLLYLLFTLFKTETDRFFFWLLNPRWFAHAQQFMLFWVDMLVIVVKTRAEGAINALKTILQSTAQSFIPYTCFWIHKQTIAPYYIYLCIYLYKMIVIIVLNFLCLEYHHCLDKGRHVALHNDCYLRNANMTLNCNSGIALWSSNWKF